MSHGYNTLSQMTSETRNFNGVGSFSLSYGYNLAGELTNITNPWNAQVGYNYDSVGRPTSVTGSIYAGVTSYVNSIAYRAFGMKQMAYSNGKTLSLGYDNRMRLASWDIPGVMGWSYAYNTPSIHENTQRVAFANNLYDHTLDRSYDYDAVGRMWASHSGAEGRAHAGYEAWGAVDGPYAENYTFDQLGNMTWRNGWGVTNAQYNYGPAFVNNKMTVNPVTGAGVGYDAAGNLQNDGSQSYSYDATGQQSYASGSGWGGAPSFSAPDPLVAGVTEVKAVHITELRTAINQVRAGVGLGAYSWTYSVTTNDWITAGPILEMRTALDQALGAPSGGYAAGLAQGQPILAIHIQELRDRVKTALGSSALSQSYDGDRLRGKKSEYGATTYYVRSSVLGGQVIAELGASGNWAKGYVYLGGQMLAIQNGAVNWVHQDPVTKSQRVTNGSGAVISTIDLDPWGGETNRSANSAFQPHKYTSYERDGNGSDDAMHRRYQSNWTRFSQPDPYDGSYDATNPQSFNRYGYVQNDPVNFTDPSGLLIWSGFIGGGGDDVIRTYTWARSDFPWDFFFRSFGATNREPLRREPSARGGRGGRSPQNPVQPNQNCIANAVEGGRVGPTNNIEADSQGNVHDGMHVEAGPGEHAVTALPAMAGRVLHAGRQSTNPNDAGYDYSVVYVLLNTRINGQHYVMGLVDMFYDTGLNRTGQPVVPGRTIGSVEGSANPVGESGLHVNLMAYSAYRKYIDRRWSYRARRSVPGSQLMDAARDPRSPFRCP